MNNEDIIKKFRKYLELSKSGLNKQWKNTRDCQSFYIGDTMSYEDKMQFQAASGEKKRATVKFNKVMTYVDGVCGFMQQNRRIAKYVARVDNSLQQQFYSKYANAVADYIRDNIGSQYLESEQDLDMLVCGYGATETDMSYIQGNASLTPNGDIIKVKLDPLRTFWDASAKGKNLRDARWCGYWVEHSLEDALNLFSGSEEGDFEESSDDADFIITSNGSRFNRGYVGSMVEWTNDKEPKVKVYNFQWYEIESYWQAENPLKQIPSPDLLAQMQALQSEEGGLFAFNPEDDRLTFDAKTKSELVKIFGSYIQPVEFKRRVYYTAVISGEHVFTSFKSIPQSDFSIQFKTGTYDNINKIWIGMVNNMMQPQLYYNKALTELMFVISSNSKGGVIVEKGSVEDIQTFERKYASTTAVMVVNEGAVSGGKIMPKGQNIPTTGLDGIIQLSDASIADASGVDKAFLGSGMEVQQSGILYRRRIRQVISTIAKYFDSISDYQRRQARIDLDFIKIWAENNEGLMFELIEDDGTFSTAEIRSDKFMVEYGITINEGMETAEDKQEKAETISMIADKLALIDPNAAKVAYTISLKYLNLDGEDKRLISEAMQGQQQQIDPAYVQQLEQQIKILTDETRQAEIKKLVASAEKDMASVDEIRAKTTKTLEEAQQKGLENDVITNGNFNKTQLTI